MRTEGMLCVCVGVLCAAWVRKGLHAVTIRGPLVDGVAVHRLQAVLFRILLVELPDVARDDYAHVYREGTNPIRNTIEMNIIEMIRTEVDDPVEDEPPDGNEANFVDVLAFILDVLVRGAVLARLNELGLAHREHQDDVGNASDDREAQQPV